MFLAMFLLFICVSFFFVSLSFHLLVYYGIVFNKWIHLNDVSMVNKKVIATNTAACAGGQQQQELDRNSEMEHSDHTSKNKPECAIFAKVSTLAAGLVTTNGSNMVDS